MLGPHPSDTGMVMFLSCGRISLDLIMRMTISFGSRNRKDGLLRLGTALTVTGYVYPTLVAPFLLLSHFWFARRPSVCWQQRRWHLRSCPSIHVARTHSFVSPPLSSFVISPAFPQPLRRAAPLSKWPQVLLAAGDFPRIGHRSPSRLGDPVDRS